MTNMKKIIFFITLITAAYYTKSQNLIIDDTVYKPGIYRTFEEFKYNNPSIDLNYEVTPKDRGHKEVRVTYYYIMIDKKMRKEIGRVFGFSDGNNVYVRHSLSKLGPKNGFARIEYFGNYCYFESIYCKHFYESNFITYPHTYQCRLFPRIIDIDSGEIIRLTTWTLRELIADDPELLNEFSNESQKNEKLKEYIIRYLEKQ